MRRGNVVPSVLDGGHSAGGWNSEPSVWQRMRNEPEMVTALRIFGPAIAILAVQAVVFPIPLGSYLFGAVLGGLSALVAIGMALVYRANRILNFAQGHLGLVPATIAVALWKFTDLWLPFAFGIGLLGAIVLGGALDVVVIRRFSQAPRLVLTVATIGIAQLLAVSAIGLSFLWSRRPVELAQQRLRVPFDLSFEIQPVLFRSDHLAALLVTPLCLLAVATFLNRTPAGIAVRAAAERRDRASLLGIPVARLGTLIWVLAAVLSFLAVFFEALVHSGLGIANPLLGFGATLAALAALMLGRLDDLPSVAASAVALGILQHAVIRNHGDTPELAYVVLALVVAAGLAVRRIAKLRAGQDEISSWQATEQVRPIPRQLRRLPEIRLVRTVGLLAALGLAAVVPLFLDSADNLKATAVICFAIVGLSVVVLTGWAGQISLGQMAFAGYGAAFGAFGFLELGWDAMLVVPLCGAFGAGIAVLVGLPALRLRGIFLAAITLAFAVASGSFLLSQRHIDLIPRGRIEQVRLFDLPVIGGITLETPRDTYYFTLAIAVLLFAAMAGIRRSRTGRVLTALRENELAAQSHGVGVVHAKLTGFALSGGLAAIAGCLYMMSVFGYSETLFQPSDSLAVFTATVVGGMGSMLGAILGALFLRGGAWFLTGNWVYVPSAVGVLVVLWLFPSGMSGLLYRGRDVVLRQLARRHDITVPSLAGSASSPDDPVQIRPDGAERRKPEPVPGAVLDVKGIDVSYGNLQVLFDVDLHVAEGEVVALLGTNGAGKSTLLKAVSGLLSPATGSIRLDGADLTGAPPHVIAAQGVAQMPGGHAVFPGLTVDENLRMACWLERRRNGPAGPARRSGIPIGNTGVTLPPVDAPLEERMEAALDLFPVLRWRLDDHAADLSGGQQQMLSLGMALLAQPRVLLIDELSLGLAPVVVGQLLEVVRAIAAQGTAIVLVEQSVNVALTLAERAVFMEKGQVRFTGATADLLERPDLLRSVFLEGASSGLDEPDGGEGVSAAPDSSDLSRAAAADWAALPSAATAAPSFELRGITVSFGGIRAVDDVSLSMEPGEIVGVIGPNGAGKTTLFDVISGVTPADRGLVLLDGVDVATMQADERARHGIGRSFQDALLYPALTVEETLAVAFDRWLPAKDPFRAALRSPDQRLVEAEVRDRVDELIRLLGLEPYRDKFVSELSTGSRRIVDLGCILAHHPSVVLLDEPSSGIAQREAEALGPLLKRARDVLGASMLVVEHDMSLVTGLADRLVAMDQGQVIAAGPSDDVLHHPAVVASYLGGSKAAIERSGPTSAPGPDLVPAVSVPVDATGAAAAVADLRDGDGPGAPGGQSGGRPPGPPRHRRTGGHGEEDGDGEGDGGAVGRTNHGRSGRAAPRDPERAERQRRGRHLRRRQDRLRAYALPLSSVMALVAFATVGGLGSRPGPSAAEAPSPAERAGVEGAADVPLPYDQADDAQRASTTWVDNCDTETGRIEMASIFAPPCVPAHEGDNGGSTWTGVTEDTIRIVSYVPEGGDLLQIFTDSLDSTDDMAETRDQYVTMFNDLFETYGRQVEMVEFDATGAMDDEVAARADAIRLAEEVEPFIVLGGPPLTTAFADELANRGIICIACGIATPDSFHQDNAPFMWGPLPTAEEFLPILGEYMFNRLLGEKATYAGDPDMQDEERNLGIIRFEQRDPVFEDVARLATIIAEANDVEFAADEVYVFDLDTMQERAASIITEMKQSGVTTIVFLGDPLMPIYLTQQATDQNYFPEWVVTGTPLTDTTAVGRYYDQKQWENAFGLSSLPVQTELDMGEGYRIHDWYFGEAPAASKTSQIVYQAVFQAFLGIHMAGPDLRPDTFRDGTFNFPTSGGGPTTPQVSFGDNDLFISESLSTRIDYLGVDDMTEIWWDADAEGPDETGNEGTGMWRYANNGQRYLPGEMPSEPIDAFREEDSVTLFDDFPEEDRPPDYPSPRP